MISTHADLPKPGESKTILIPGAAGHIESLIATPRELAASPGFAVVCHPHPLMGGALSNKVAYTLASCALKAGFHAVRFNFRGVGKSSGVHDECRGESDDVISVADWMRERLPGAELLLMGFSFGSFVSIQAAARAKPKLQVSVAPPFGKYFGGASRPARPPCPWLVIHSRDDDVVSYAETQAELSHYDPAPELITVDGAGHFFHGRLGDIQHAVLDFIARHWSR